MNNQVIEALVTRRSIRSYTDKQVEVDDIWNSHHNSSYFFLKFFL